MLYRLLCEKAETYPDRVAIAGEHRSLTFSQLLKETTKVAHFLQQELKLKAEDPVIIGLRPCPEFYALFYGAAAIGAMAVPVSRSGKIPAQIKEMGPAVAAGDKDFIRAIEAAGFALRGVIVWDRENGLQLPDRSGPFRRRNLIRKERVLAASSSGATGDPTLSLRSAEVIVRRAKLAAKVYKATSKDAWLCPRSIWASLAMPLVTGGKLVVREQFERFRVAEAIAKERVTRVQMSPFYFDLLASIPPRYPVDFSSLRLCISGGAPLPRAVFDRFYRRFGIRLHQTYTGTHLTPAITYNLSADIPEAVGHVSGPFPMAVVDEKGKVVKPGEVGEIVVDVAKGAVHWLGRTFDDEFLVLGISLKRGDAERSQSQDQPQLTPVFGKKRRSHGFSL